MGKALFNRTHPADAANIYIRNLLCDISNIINPEGFTENDWKKTLLFFNHCCAFTGKKLSPKDTVKDHLIAHNRESCGLHLFGNIVPTSDEVNKNKSNMSYYDFINKKLTDDKIDKDRTKVDLIQKIEEFQEISGYKSINIEMEKLKPEIKAKYDYIQSLCLQDKNFYSEVSELKKLKDDLIQFSAKDIFPKIRIWSNKPRLNVHKIIAKLKQSNGKISRPELTKYILDTEISKNPEGAITSLMTNAGNSYGKVFEEDGEYIVFAKDVKEFIEKQNWIL